MKKILFVCMICVLALLGISNMAIAQEYAPQAGDKIVSLRLGRAVDYGDVNFYEINRGTQSSSTSISQPYSATNYQTNSVVNAIGVEAKYFVTSQIAVRFAGSGIISSSPSRDAVQGVSDPTGVNYPGTTLPSYVMLEGKTTKQFHIDLGADYYFTTKIARLQPYAGIQLNSIYGQMEIFDGFRGVYQQDQGKWIDGEYVVTAEEGEVIPTYDTRRGEAYGLGASIVGGIDYYLAEGFFLGVEIKGASYMYNVKKIFHQQGMEAQDAATHNTSFLTQPVIKLGFKF